MAEKSRNWSRRNGTFSTTVTPSSAMPKLVALSLVNESSWYQTLALPLRSLVPDLVTTFIAAPDMLPYWAGAPMASTWTSSTVSGLGHQKAWPLSLRVLFWPSMLQEFEAVLEPKADNFQASFVCCWTTPGETAIMSQKLRVVGRSSMNSAS